VLLQNDNGVLPLAPGLTLSVFGRVQVNYFFGGYGSGALPNAPYKTSLLAGLQANPGITLNETLAEMYTAWCAANPVSGEPRTVPEMPLTDEVVMQAAGASDTALVVIGRAAGEGSDTT
jgi:beta-glucosidase